VRLIPILTVTFGLCAEASAEDKSIMACSEAVSISVSTTPSLRFTPREILRVAGQDVIVEEAFQFQNGPFESATVRVTSTGPEGGVWGRGSGAPFEVWAETVSSGGKQGRRQAWELVDKGERRSNFDAPQLVYSPRRGFPWEPGVTLSTVTTGDVPLIELSFFADLGGANAINGSETKLLLDFGTSPPRARASAVCASNQGGGICTGLDSMETLRADMTCWWEESIQDVRCSQVRREPRAHRTFDLTASKTARFLEGEHPTVEAAERWLRQRPPGENAVVAGLGAVSVVGLPSPSLGRGWTLLGSDQGFFLVPITDSPGTTTARVALKRLPGTSEVAESDAFAGGPDWTPEGGISFFVRPMASAKGLLIFEAVVTEDDMRSVIWIGLEERPGGILLDALEVATERRTYSQCGYFAAPASVVRVGKVQKPFRARVEVQPPNLASMQEEGDRMWGVERWEPAADCIRSGEILWMSGRGFQAAIAPAKCRSPATPFFVRIDGAGKVTLSETENEAARRADRR
jgi:hypothetical protein